MFDNWTTMKLCNDLDNIPDVPCIYFLFNDWELIYIGETKNLKKRCYNHKGYSEYNKKFNRIIYLPFVGTKKQRIILEDRYIEQYKPKWNFYDVIYEMYEKPVHLEILENYRKKKLRKQGHIKGWI